MPIKRCGGGCGGFERGEGGHNGTENKKAHLSVSIFDTAYGGTRSRKGAQYFECKEINFIF